MNIYIENLTINLEQKGSTCSLPTSCSEQMDYDYSDDSYTPYAFSFSKAIKTSFWLSTLLTGSIALITPLSATTALTIFGTSFIGIFSIGSWNFYFHIGGRDCTEDIEDEYPYDSSTYILKDGVLNRNVLLELEKQGKAYEVLNSSYKQLLQRVEAQEKGAEKALGAIKKAYIARENSKYKESDIVDVEIYEENLKRLR